MVTGKFVVAMLHSLVLLIPTFTRASQPRQPPEWIVFSSSTRTRIIIHWMSNSSFTGRWGFKNSQLL